MAETAEKFPIRGGAGVLALEMPVCVRSFGAARFLFRRSVVALQFRSPLGAAPLPPRPRVETPIERIFRKIFGRKMNAAERLYFLRKHKAH